MSSDEDLNIRFHEISDFAEILYENYNCLHYEPLDIFINKSLSMFFNSKLSIKEIKEQLFNIVEEKDFYSSNHVSFVYDDTGRYEVNFKKK